MVVKPGEGEFLLSRRLQELGLDHGAHAVLVGTYAVSSHLVFVSCRVVSTATSGLLAGFDFELPRDEITQSLMAPRRQAAAGRVRMMPGCTWRQCRHTRRRRFASR
jgi:hypothetical protein